MTPTEDRQRVRTQLGVNMVVEAGAGTGKTTLLIERLCLALLVQAIAAPRLVALTFTEKAAAEIKTRLLFKLQALLRALKEPALEDDLLKLIDTHFAVPRQVIQQRAEAALEQLDRSAIGTIHSFCADILRAYPLQAGLTPQAEIDSGLRGRQILEQCWHQFLDEQLAAGSVHAAQWKQVLQQVSLPQLYAYVTQMCSGKIQHYDYFAQKDKLIILCRQRAVQARQAAAAFLDKGKKPRTIERALQQAAERLEQAACWLQTGQLPGTPLQETITFTSIPQNWDAASAEQAKALCRFAEQADPWVQTLVYNIHQLLEGLIKRVRDRYRQEGIVSFDDLIVKTRDLLQHNLLVRRLLQEKYDAFYIDEFQDTDPVQGELLLFLAACKGETATTWKEVELAPGKLFVVGDPKQSIYRFRGADITAYELFTDLILHQGGQKAYLRQNFRSEPDIVNLANEVCSVVMQEKKAFQPAYEAIFTAKSSVQAEPGTEMALICPPEQKVSADQYRHNQAQFVAQWIEQHVGKLTLRNGQKLAYKDIAILLRATTTLSPYTEALARRNIPFAVEEDKDFFNRPEIADFLNLLRAIEDPQDRISLVGVLRSPWGALTDEEIYQAAQRRELDFRTVSAHPNLERLYKILRHFAAQNGRLPLHQWLRDLLQETFLLEACAYAYDGPRSMQTITRLVELAAGYTQKTPLTLGQFLARADEFLKQELGHLTAWPAGELAQAVSVMSIHKSKGLEFPVVILVDISRKEAPAAVQRPEHLYSWKDNVHGLRVGKYADINLAWLEEQQREQDRCEEVRVLYVALTRAREKLLLVGNGVCQPNTLAAAFAQAGLFPELEKKPALLGRQTRLQLHYVPYTDPQQFIYQHRPTKAVGGLAQADLAAWRQTHTKRQAAYQAHLQQPVLGAPSHLMQGSFQDDRAAQLGSQIHAWLAEQIRQSAAQSTKQTPAAAQLLKEQPWLQHFVTSSVYQWLAAQEQLGIEMPFSMQTQQGLVNGVIDLLIRDEQGNVWVLDYKTDQVAPGQEPAAAQAYQAQLSVYAQAAHKLYPKSIIKSAVVFVRTACLVELAPGKAI